MPALPLTPSRPTCRAGRTLAAAALLALPLAALAQPGAEAASAAASAAAAPALDNPYGLASLWAGSDGIAKGVLLMMALMSVGSWYILIVKLLEQARIGRQAREAQAHFWSAGSVAQGSTALSAGSPFRFIAESALEATKKHEGLLGQIDLNEWVTMSLQRAIDRVGSRLQDGLAFLATVGSTAPFVGLFGTVWGIYHALTAIGVAGQASIDKVAGPVGESLIMTAIGLAVAVPAVLGYNWLVRRNKGAMDEVRAFGADLHAVLLASGPRAGRD
ncbi:MotA/TolQ/ExbB proton channel family protein [Aquariibacter albus]|uniref:Biopolymer transport protein ExbB n=1 Tax=Aquariibacter albus TaxID=2759899 RepID=A0A839HRU9_9BURK|nr:MotA/TolQ/ExbB proton channel family protein [Aquariibacter albus]MBB1160544.1 MotA/TolQ/ExbB proton channel family protein [Aquariibacter albus]